MQTTQRRDGCQYSSMHSIIRDIEKDLKEMRLMIITQEMNDSEHEVVQLFSSDG